MEVWNNLQPAHPIGLWLKKIVTSKKSVFGSGICQYGTTLNTISGKKKRLNSGVTPTPRES